MPVPIEWARAWASVLYPYPWDHMWIMSLGLPLRPHIFMWVWDYFFAPSPEYKGVGKKLKHYKNIVRAFFFIKK